MLLVPSGHLLKADEFRKESLRRRQQGNLKGIGCAGHPTLWRRGTCIA